MRESDGDNFERELSAYIDGELSADEARQVEQRLAQSPEARERLAELRSISAQLAVLPRHRAPRDLSSIMRRTIETRAAAPSERSIVTRWLTARRGIQAIGAAALLVIAAFIGWEALRPAPVVETSSLRGRERESVAPSATRSLPQRPLAASPAVPGRETRLGREAAPLPEDSIAASDPLRSAGAGGGSVVSRDSERAVQPEESGRGALGAASSTDERGVLAAGFIVEPGGTAVAATTDARVQPPSPDSRSMVQYVADRPRIDIIIEPSSDGEFDAARNILAAWQDTVPPSKPDQYRIVRHYFTGSSSQPQRRQIEIAAAASLPEATPVAAELVAEIPAANVVAMLDTLEQTAPRQVQVKMSGRWASKDLFTQMTQTPAPGKETQLGIPPAPPISDFVDGAQASAAGQKRVSPATKPSAESALEPGDDRGLPQPTYFAKRADIAPRASAPSENENNSSTQAADMSDKTRGAAATPGPLPASEKSLDQSWMRDISHSIQHLYFGLPFAVIPSPPDAVTFRVILLEPVRHALEAESTQPAEQP